MLRMSLKLILKREFAPPKNNSDQVYDSLLREYIKYKGSSQRENWTLWTKRDSQLSLALLKISIKKEIVEAMNLKFTHFNLSEEILITMKSALK